MKLSQYLRDKLLFILLQAGFIVFLGIFLSVMRISVYGVCFILSVCFLLDVLALAAEYLQKSIFYNRLIHSLDQLDKKHLISELIQMPDFQEGVILCESLRTATKSMNDEIAKYKISQEEYKEYIETWIHEIKTPIACIGLLCENNPEPFATGIAEETRKIDRFVEQALFYARSTSLEKDYTVRRVTLERLIKAAIKQHSRELIKSRTEIRLENLDLEVLSDPKWLDFILGQIFANSIRYRSEPPTHPLLKITAFQSDTQVVLSVEDNGIGITGKDLSRVFEKGFTGENGRKYSKSTGIGLYLCKTLCDKMNHGFTLDSVSGRGTTARITFPKDKARLWES